MISDPLSRAEINKEAGRPFQEVEVKVCRYKVTVAERTLVSQKNQRMLV